MTGEAKHDARFPKSVLAAIDAHGRSDHALHAAVWLSERFGAKLELVHAFPPRPILWGKRDDMPEWTAGTEAAGLALRASLRDVLARAPSALALKARAESLRVHIASGHPAEVILERARAADADCVVLGAHKKRGLFDFGSTARGVLAGTRAGVWLQVQPMRAIRRILAPIDFSADSTRALEVARDLARELSASVTVLHAFISPELWTAREDMPPVYTPELTDSLRRSTEEELARSVAAFPWSGVQHDSRFEDGDASESVLALQREFDLIVMGRHGHTRLAVALLGSTTYAVMRAAETPVLAVRAPERPERAGRA
jgi:nucleotide-binding universal stress UspA family protein